MSENIFQEIIDKKIPADIVYEDNLSIAFNDISPQAPTHILIIPKKNIAKISDANDEDENLLGHLLLVAKKVTSDMGITDYRIIINNGSEAGQTVFHLHLHILAGRPFGWPPG
ncbi:MAG: histidine triad nucleotide-binding protein [Gammaproteobacteria bacterium]|tara:strand:+ start:1766 stop:2104 length:339 start_codon:yes stop_codon:yes gene_type:complete